MLNYLESGYLLQTISEAAATLGELPEGERQEAQEKSAEVAKRLLTIAVNEPAAVGVVALFAALQTATALVTGVTPREVYDVVQQTIQSLRGAPPQKEGE